MVMSETNQLSNSFVKRAFERLEIFRHESKPIFSSDDFYTNSLFIVFTILVKDLREILIASEL